MYERSLVPQYMYDPGDAVPPPPTSPLIPGNLTEPTLVVAGINIYTGREVGGGGPGHDGEQIVMETGTARESKKRE